MNKKQRWAKFLKENPDFNGEKARKERKTLKKELRLKALAARKKRYGVHEG